MGKLFILVPSTFSPLASLIAYLFIYFHLSDIHPGNMLLGVSHNSLLKSFEENEFTSPVPRKPISHSQIIYLSRLMRPKEGPMLLSDFGEARIGPGPHGGDIMPLEYRAPETLLYVGWSYPVDIWSVGMTVGLDFT
jgi:serine/threonine-protein kinase SRPK3